MPLSKKWSHFDMASVSQETNKYGIYEMASPDKKILYIGEGHVHERLKTHFINSREPIPGASLYRVEYTKSKERAKQRERAEIRTFMRDNQTCPKYNDRLG